MNYIESSRKIRQLMAKATETDPDDWFLCLKARYGMQVVFTAIHDIEGKGQVITLPYTCISAVNPILTSGMTPIYSDIEPSTLSIGTPAASLCKSGKVRAIMMQHTLGLIADKSETIKYANQHKLLIIEDSAHCLGRMVYDTKKHPIADISVHSFGVEKVLTRTKFGGAIYVNPALRKKNPKLYDEITSNLLTLPQPSSLRGIRIRSYRINNAVLQRMPASIKPGFRDAIVKAKILEAPIAPIEQEGKQGRAYAPNLWINERILEQLPTLPINYNRRQKNTITYSKHLKSDKFKPLATTKEPLLAFPILFEDNTHANLAYDLLSANGYFIRRWYSPLLYPGPSSNRIYKYNPKSCPVAEDISPRVLCLPTDVKGADCEKIIALLNPPQK